LAPEKGAETAAPPSGYVYDDAPTPASQGGEEDPPGTDEPPAEDDPPTPAPEPEQTGPKRVDLNAAPRAKCTRRGGDFTRTPAGLYVCVQRTRDANRSCSKASDCQGACLARSGTCAPVTPLIGCYEQITERGGMATVCVD
jgi:hypothetical protein